MRILIALALTLALAVPATAHHCTTWSTSNGIAAGEYYLYDACVDHATGGEGGLECSHWGVWNAWVYQESNGIAGLQRADEIQDDTCHGLIAGDTVLF